jgi:predicted GNAT family acetyltransferase
MDSCTSGIPSVLQVTEEQWQVAFASGKESLAHDAEWLELIAEMKERVCQRAADRQKFREWNEHMSKRTSDDIFKDGMITNATLSGNSPEVNEARAKVVKIQIVRYLYEHDRQSCLLLRRRRNHLRDKI